MASLLLVVQVAGVLFLKNNYYYYCPSAEHFHLWTRERFKDSETMKYSCLSYISHNLTRIYPLLTEDNHYYQFIGVFHPLQYLTWAQWWSPISEGIPPSSPTWPCMSGDQIANGGNRRCPVSAKKSKLNIKSSASLSDTSFARLKISSVHLMSNSRRTVKFLSHHTAEPCYTGPDPLVYNAYCAK